MMKNSTEGCRENNIPLNSNLNCIDVENKKPILDEIRSIKTYNKNDDDDEGSDDGVTDDIDDVRYLPEISNVKRKQDKFYQDLLPIGNGIYNGTINEKFQREGSGTFCINNNEEFYSGSWKDDQYNGYGFNFKNHGSTIYHGEFQNGTLKEGYGKIILEDGYEYEGKIQNGKFNGLGSLSIKIKGLTEINKSNVEKESLKIIAEWKEGQTEKGFIYLNEIEEYYQYQYKVFSNSLESLISLDKDNYQKQREYLQNLIDLYEKRFSNINLLKEIVTHPTLPRELKSSADLLLKLDHSHTNLNKYTKTDPKKTYKDRIRDICQRGLRSYARRLAWFEDEKKIDCISSKIIFDQSLNSFLNKFELDELKKVLYLNPSVVELIRKLIRFANERLIQISSQYRSQYIDIHETFLKDIWLNYFENLKYDSISNRLDDQNRDRYHFYSDCYSNLLELSLLSQYKIETELEKEIEDQLNTSIEVKLNEDINIDHKINNDEIESIICKAMKFVLNNFKPWDNLQVQEWSSYLNQPIDQDTSTKEIADKLLIKILQDAKERIHHFLERNRKISHIEQFSTHLESVIVYYQKSLLEDKNLNYQSKTKEIKNIFLYFLQISQNENNEFETMTKLQLESIKSFIQGKQTIVEVIDHFLHFNTEFSKLSKIFHEHFPRDQHEQFNKNSLEIISLLTSIFQTILENENINETEDENKTNCSRILNKYKSKNLDDALRKSVLGGNIVDAKFLIELGANINQPDSELKKTVLYSAIKMKDIDLILVLLEKGAQIDIEDKKKRTPIEYAKRYQIDLISLSNQIKNTRKINRNLFENKLYAMQKMINLLTNLRSLDFTWYVQKEQIKYFDNNLFKKVGEKDIYQGLDIEQAKQKVNDSCPHYVLEALIELLQIIKNFKITNQVTDTGMIKLRAELIMGVEKSFKYFNDQIKYNSLAKFKEDCVTPFRDVIEDNQSYEIFCQKLEKMDLYFLYNRKLKEITLDQALDLFQEKNQILFRRKKIKNAFLKYEELFRKYFSEILEKNISIKEIVKKTKEFANKSKFNRQTIPDIIAGLAIILSLTNSDFIEKKSNGEYRLTDKFNKNYLLQPHCIQILGVLIILNIDGDTNSIPSNHLAEILTGQGKSWALALLAGYFSLTGYEVTVGCYSDYLSQRDEKDFKKNFDPFNFLKKVEYKTFESMCNDKLSINNKTLRGIVSDIVSGKELFPEYTKENEKQKSILLIDEVDVFFSKNFGTMYYPVKSVKNKNIANMQKDIWEEIMTGNTDKTKLIDLVESRIHDSIKEDKMISILKSIFLKSQLEEMIETAIEIYEDMKNENKFKEKYKLIDDNIYMKDSDEKYVSNTLCRYENSFYYLKLKYEKEQSFKQVQLNEDNFGYLSVKSGTISYSELPKSYDGIFGVSGSLKDLSNGEQSVLKHYNISEKSYYPSFFGRSKLIFDKKNDFVIRESKNDWFNKIITDTREKICQDRSVLIFFESENMLDEFYNSYSGDLGITPFFITQNKIFDGKEEKIYHDSYVNQLIKDEYAGHHGKVTLLTREFGRGVDFQAETKVNQQGGIHVIQTFFSIDIKEEIQIKGRTARKDELGSYQLILCLDHLQKSESKVSESLRFDNITKDTTYKELDKQRREKTDSFCADKLKCIEKNKESHEKTLDFFQRAITQCNENNREDFIKEILQLHESVNQ